MEAIKEIITNNPIRQTKELLLRGEKDLRYIESSGSIILRLLQKIRVAAETKGADLDIFQDLERRWTKLSHNKSHPWQIKRITTDTRNLMDELIRSEEKTHKKNQVCKIRNTLQNLFLGDNRETIIHWEIFEELKELLQEELFENCFSNTLNKYQHTTDEWRRIYLDLIFILNKDKENAFQLVQVRIDQEKLTRLGGYIEKMLDEITAAVHEYELENGLY